MVEGGNVRDRPTIAIAFGDPEVRVGVRRDLWEVGDDEHLVAPGKRPQASPDRVCAPPADAGIHLIEHEGRRLVGPGENLLDRECHARQLAPGRDPGQRPCGFSRVRGEPEDDVVRTGRIEGQGVPVEFDGRFARTRGPTPDLDLEGARREAEPPQDLVRATAQPCRSLAAQRPEPGRGFRHRGQQSCIVQQAAIPLALHAPKAGRLLRGAFAVGDDRLLVVAVSPLQSEDHGQPLLERGHRSGIVIDGIEKGAELARDVLQLGIGAGQALGDRLKPGIDPGECSSLPERRTERAACRLAVPVEGLPDCLPTGRDGLPVASRCQARPDVGGLGGPESGSGDLGDLVVQEVQKASEFTLIGRERGQGRPVLPPLRDGRRHGCACLRVATVRVEEIPLPALVEEPTLVMLAVDLDEGTGNLGEPGRRHGAIVDTRRGPTGQGHLADGDERLRQPVEQGLDPRDLRAVPDERGVCPCAKGQPKGVDEQALAGSGLAREHVQARSKHQTQVIYQAEVHDREFQQAPGDVGLGRGRSLVESSGIEGVPGS